jgi:hypothetical protein
MARYMPHAETVESFAEQGPRLFGISAGIAIGVGILFVALSRPIRKLCVGIN